MPQTNLPFDGAILSYDGLQLAGPEERFNYPTLAALKANWSLVPMNGAQWDSTYGWEHEQFDDSMVTLLPQGGIRLSARRQDGLPDLAGRRIASLGGILVNKTGPDRLGWAAPGTPYGQIQGYRYGLFELRAKLPGNGVSGVWPTFWLFTPNLEIDVLDNLTDNPARIMQQAIICWGGKPGNHQWNAWERVGPAPGFASPVPAYEGGQDYTAGQVVAYRGQLYRATAAIARTDYVTKPHQTSGPAFSEGYHTFSVLWTPTEITFFIDGLKINTITQAATNYQSDSAQIIMGLTATDYTDRRTTASLDIEYLRIYRPRATGGPAVAYQGPFYERETRFNGARPLFGSGPGEARPQSSGLQALRPNPDWHPLDSALKPDFFFADANGVVQALLWSPSTPTGADFAWRLQACGARLYFPRTEPQPSDFNIPNPLNPPRPSGPYAVSYGAGRAEVMYQNEAGQLACAHRNAAGTWVREPFVTDADTQFADSLFVAQAGRAVYYRSTRNNLVGFYRQGNAWVRELVHRAAAGRVAGDVVYDDMRDQFYYRGTDGNIYGCVRNGTHAALVPALPAPAARCLIATPDFRQLFFIDRNGSVQRLYRTAGTGWVVELLDASVRNAADNLVMRGTNVFYRSTDGRIFNYYRDGAGWRNACLDWDVTNVAGDLRLHSLEPKLFYRGLDNRLHMFYFTNRWHAKALQWNTGTLFVEPPVLSATDDLYALGLDGKLWEFARRPTGTRDVNGPVIKPLPMSFD